MAVLLRVPTRGQNHTITAVRMACLRNAILLKHPKDFYVIDYSTRTQTCEAKYISQHGRKKGASSQA